MLDLKAREMSAIGMVMVHDLLVLTNDFLSDKNRAHKTDANESGESLFQKMQTEEQRQRKRRVRAGRFGRSPTC